MKNKNDDDDDYSVDGDDDHRMLISKNCRGVPAAPLCGFTTQGFIRNKKLASEGRGLVL